MPLSPTGAPARYTPGAVRAAAAADNAETSR
jgi:hypothetical protein